MFPTPLTGPLEQILVVAQAAHYVVQLCLVCFAAYGGNPFRDRDGLLISLGLFPLAHSFGRHIGYLAWSQNLLFLVALA